MKYKNVKSYKEKNINENIKNIFIEIIHNNPYISHNLLYPKRSNYTIDEFLRKDYYVKTY